MPYTIRELENKLLTLQDAADRGETQHADSIALLKEELKGRRAASSFDSASKITKATPPVPESRGGASFGPYPAAKAKVAPGYNGDIIPAIIATAPARSLAGIADLGVTGGRWAGEKLGLDMGEAPDMMTPAVGRLTDALAGQKVEESIPRSMLEGVVTGPVSGPKTLANILPQMVAGAAAGGTAHAVAGAGGGPIPTLAAALLAGKVGGSVAKNLGLTPAELLAKGRVQTAVEGLTPEQFNQARGASAQAAGQGVPLVPSQAFQVPAEGLQRLQGALEASKASGAPAFRETLRQQPSAVDALIERMRLASGQRPRTDDDLAAGLQKEAKAGLRAEGRAVNDATRPLYNDPLGTGWRFSPALTNSVKTGFQQALRQYDNVEPNVAAALRTAGESILALLQRGQVTPEEMTRLLSYVKKDLPAYKDMLPGVANRVQGVVKETIAPLEQLIAKHAPPLAQANAMQADLRSTLANQFNEVTRQAKASGGTEAVLRGAEGRPEMMAAVGRQNPQLAQEVLQRQLERTIDSVTALGATTKLPQGQEGVRLQAELTRGLRGAAFSKNLELLFPGRPEAASGFRALLEVAANASKPTTLSHNFGQPNVAQEVARGLAGGPGTKAAVMTRLLGGGMLGHLKDNATISILQRPDVLDRLEKLARLPTPRLTPAAIAAAVPELFQETPNGP